MYRIIDVAVRRSEATTKQSPRNQGMPGFALAKTFAALFFQKTFPPLDTPPCNKRRIIMGACISWAADKIERDGILNTR
jgi:hypothetical protein